MNSYFFCFPEHIHCQVINAAWKAKNDAARKAKTERGLMPGKPKPKPKSKTKPKPNVTRRFNGSDQRVPTPKPKPKPKPKPTMSRAGHPIGRSRGQVTSASSSTRARKTALEASKARARAAAAAANRASHPSSSAKHVRAKKVGGQTKKTVASASDKHVKKTKPQPAKSATGSADNSRPALGVDKKATNETISVTAPAATNADNSIDEHSVDAGTVTASEETSPGTSSRLSETTSADGHPKTLSHLPIANTAGLSVSPTGSTASGSPSQNASPTNAANAALSPTLEGSNTATPRTLASLGVSITPERRDSANSAGVGDSVGEGVGVDDDESILESLMSMDVSAVGDTDDVAVDPAEDETLTF